MSGTGEGRWFAHDSACVDEGAEIGEGTKIWHFSHVMKGSKIGRRCNLGQNVVISPGVVIGDDVKIQNNVSIYTGVILEDEVFCGPSMVFTNIVTPRSGTPRNRPEDYHRTLVRKGATIGANATIICGSTLGRYSFVGAGAVVTKDVPDYAVVVGNPARLHGYACECGLKLPLKASDAEREARCAECGRVYEMRSGAIHCTGGPVRKQVAEG
ncbi:MAG: acyltransferase [Deltaproteobacteria bacterium]|nr:acyltransferase [Deltaproteobacteria bacterium]